jgi:hypothetical protein
MLGNEGGRALLLEEGNQQRRFLMFTKTFPMFTKTKLALAAALVFSAASAVQASNDNEEKGGYRLGPMGQQFGGVNPVYHRSLRHAYRYHDGGAFAYVPGYRLHWQRD